MTKGFWIVLAVIVLGFLGFAFLQDSGDSKTTGGTPTSHIKGSASSGVKLVEYGDFQCPACGAYYPTVTKIYDKYQDKIQFQFHHFPLSGIHPNAFAAARAAEAAGMQNKFWEMYDLLFSTQQSWSSSSSVLRTFKEYAQQLDLKADKFENDYYSAKTNAAVNGDKNQGEKLGVEATPTFFLDGEELGNDQLTDDNGQPSLDAFSKLIDAAIAENKN